MSKDVNEVKQQPSLVELGKSLIALLDELEESNKKTRKMVNQAATNAQRHYDELHKHVQTLDKRLHSMEQRLDRFNSRLNSMEDVCKQKSIGGVQTM